MCCMAPPDILPEILFIEHMDLHEPHHSHTSKAACRGLHWKPEMGGGSAFDFDMYDYEDFPRHYGRAPDPFQAPDIAVGGQGDIDWARYKATGSPPPIPSRAQGLMQRLNLKDF